MRSISIVEHFQYEVDVRGLRLPAYLRPAKRALEPGDFARQFAPTVVGWTLDVAAGSEVDMDQHRIECLPSDRGTTNHDRPNPNIATRELSAGKREAS
jgi:hypothetical protein